MSQINLDRLQVMNTLFTIITVEKSYNVIQRCEDMSLDHSLEDSAHRLFDISLMHISGHPHLLLII